MNELSGANSWLQKVAQRLSSEGFVMTGDVRFGDTRFKGVAHRSRFELSKFGNSETFFIFGEFGKPTPQSIRWFSGEAFRYAKASRSFSLPCGFFESVWCFAVGVAESIDEETARIVRSERPTMHWAAAEIPVVYEWGRNKLHFFEKTPIWGAAYYAGFRAQIGRYLGTD
jgi:hypothetical protein